MANTEHRGYPLPDEAKNVRQEIENLQQQVLPMLDNDIHALFVAIAGLAPAAHGHAIGDITGLTTALDGKMPASTTFSLGDLTDTDGVDAAPDGYVMVKSGTLWVAQAALAALGTHGHTMAQVSGLETALAAHDTALANRVSYSAQTKTDPEKAQALANIGAIGNEQDQSAQGFSSARKINILKNTLQAWEQIGPIINQPTNVAEIAWTDLGAYTDLRLRGRFAVNTNGSSVGGQMRPAGGLWTGPYDRLWQDQAASTLGSGLSTGAALVYANAAEGWSTANWAHMTMEFFNFNSGAGEDYMRWFASIEYYGNITNQWRRGSSVGHKQTIGTHAEFRLTADSGGQLRARNLVLEGMRG